MLNIVDELLQIKTNSKIFSLFFYRIAIRKYEFLHPSLIDKNIKMINKAEFVSLKTTIAYAKYDGC